MDYRDNDSMILEYQQGQQKELLSEIIENNLGLIHVALKSFRWGFSNHPKYDEIISYDDFFNQGVFGLATAIKNYDPSLGAFSTYAIICIKQPVYRFYYNNSRVIRVPYEPQKAFKQLKKSENEYIKQYGYHPNTKELSVYSGISIDEIQELRGIFSGTISIDSPISGEDESITLKDAIPDKTDYLADLEKDLTIKALRKDLEKYADDVIKNKKHIKIMFSYFDNLDSMLVKDIAEMNNVTTSKLHVILNDCIRKISRRYLDVLIEQYSDLFSSNIRRLREQDLYRSSIRNSIKLVVSKTLDLGNNITVIDSLSETSLKESVQATVRAIDEIGIMVSFIGYDYIQRAYGEQKKYIRYSSIIDFRMEGKKIVEIGCLRGLL